TLDSIHLATALSVDPLDGFVTYDDRLSQAANVAGLSVFAPGG
ncbi:MAG: VapC toxin family PIN domain ribonuclease, partial [Chloroflexi bacterium]|nr:VapC toxin family PIN domain ribonuclease [Chloroflexota bacterium]